MKTKLVIDLKSAVHEGLTLTSPELLLKRLDAILASGTEEFSLTLNDTQRKKIYSVFQMRPELGKYHITGLYDLGICQRLWLNDVFKRQDINKWLTIGCTLLTFSVQRPKKIKIFFTRNLKTGKREMQFPGVTPESEQFAEHYKQLEQWINQSIKGSLIGDRINEITRTLFNAAHLEPLYYSQALVSKRISFKHQKVVRLKDLVHFIIGKPNSADEQNPGEHVNLAHAGNCRGDFDIKNVQPTSYAYYAPEMAEAKEGDLVINMYMAYSSVSLGEFVYVINAPLKEKLFLGEHVFSLRIKSNQITKEYLYLYLKSDLVRDLFIPSQSVPNRMQYLYRDFANLPVILPNADIPMADDPKAVLAYEKLYVSYFGKKSEQESIDRYALTRGALSRTAYLDILREEYLKKVARAQYEEVTAYIEASKREMEITSKNKAYKATVVLAGSILEAFLIDWASAIDGKDYFRDPFNSRGEEMRLNEAISYLAKRIQEEAHSTWKQRELADKIKDLRNKIHANVFLRDRTEVTQQDSDNACRWLDEIMKSREYLD